MGGKMEGNRLANIVFPAPGGPIKMILCPPAAAISMHRLMFSCPLTSAKSRAANLSCCAKSFRASMVRGVKLCLPSKKSITSFKWVIPYTAIPLTMAASAAFSWGRIKPLKPSFNAWIAMGSAPLMGRIAPSKAISPMMI